jgi:hypothetical protein
LTVEPARAHDGLDRAQNVKSSLSSAASTNLTLASGSRSPTAPLPS